MKGLILLDGSVNRNRCLNNFFTVNELSIMNMNILRDFGCMKSVPTYLCKGLNLK